jgi:hypothetical protein
VAQFLAEAYRPTGNRSSLAADTARLHAAAGRLERVELLSTLYVPEDEVCFFLFESDSVELVAEASRIARLGFDRVQPVVAIDQPAAFS